MLLIQQLGNPLTVLSLILFASFNCTFAQTTVDAGFSVGFNRHTFSAENGNVFLQPGIALAATYGLPVVIKRNKWELHTGFYANDLSQSFYFTTPNGATYGERSYSNGISTYKIPLRMGRTIQWTEVTSLSPQIGFSWLTSRRTGPTGTASGSLGTTVEYSTQNSAVNKNKFMAEVGLDVNFSVFRNLILSAGAQYSLGLQPIEKLNVSYQINDQTYEGVIHSKGSGWKFNLGLKIPLYSSN